MMTPLVSIIIPCYNAEPWITECLDSAIAQTYRPLEVIVVDDGSTDRSLQILQHYAAKYPDLVRYHTGPNRGGCAARNRGFDISRGDYVMFLDADDLIDLDTVSALLTALEGKQNYMASCRWWYFKENAGSRFTYKPLRVPRNLDPIQCELSGYYAPIGSILFPRTCITMIQGWDESLKIYQDVDLKVRCFLMNVGLIRVNNGGFYYRLHSSLSVSKTKSEAVFRSQLYALQKFEVLMEEKSVLDTYELTLARSYHRLADAAKAMNYLAFSQECSANAIRLAKGKRLSKGGTRIHRVLSALIGVERKEQLAHALARRGIGRSVRRAYKDIG